MDLDADGISTWGDRYAFNYWLELGGSLAEAFAEAKIGGERIDLSGFFLSSRARLEGESALSGTEETDSSDAAAPTTPSPLQECETLATLHEAFQEEGAEQVYIAYCNPELLPYVHGHALYIHTIYLASNWLSQVSGFDDRSSGQVPLGGEQGSVFYGNDSAGPKDFYELQLDLTYGPPQLLATAYWIRKGTTIWTRGVVRFPIATPGDWCEEAFTGSYLADALALILDDSHGDFGQRGQYFVSRVTGSEAVLFDPDVAASCRRASLQLKFTASGPIGLALGTFDPTDPSKFALYHTELVDLRRKVAERRPPFSDPRYFDTGGFLPASLAFDPYSHTLFAPSEVSVLRFRADGTWVEFLSNLTGAKGLTFTWSGLLVVSEPGQLVAVDGWRYRFKRGDADANLQVNITDAILILNWLYEIPPPEEPPCWDAADVNDDSRINIADPQYLLNYLFLGGPPPPPPYSDLPEEGLGADPSPDLFGCRQYHPDKEVTWP